MYRLLAVALAFVHPADAAPNASNLPAQVDGILSPFASEGGPGASVAVIDDGKIVFEKGYGVADLTTQARVTPKSQFQLASVTKQFTAMSIMILADQGKLAYDDPVTKYIPEFPSYAKAITLRMLLHHTGGLRDYLSLMPDQPPAPVRDKDVLALLVQQDGVLFDAGTKFDYSNSGYVVLGQVIERVSGVPYHVFVHDHIFAPLHMDSTLVFEQGRDTLAQRAFGYEQQTSGAFNLSDWGNWSTVVADGGIYSTVEDLAKWDQALATSALVKPGTQALMFQSVKLPDGSDPAYGFAYDVGVENYEPCAWHSGSWAGFKAAIVRYMQSKVTVVVLVNRRNANPTALAKAVGYVYLSGKTN